MPLARVLLILATAWPQSTLDLDTLIKRATDYVTQYEAALENLIGTEEYLQNSTWLTDTRNGTRPSQKMQRRTSSDFLMIKIGKDWRAMRKVNTVDGSKVKQHGPAFQDFGDSPEANRRLVEALTIQSTAQNIGGIRRDINLPTFALRLLRKSQVARFTFERTGTARLNGKEVWEIRFREVKGPTLVVGLKGEPLYSTGVLSIEPETGAVFRTEYDVVNPYGVDRLTAQIEVTYAMGSNVPVLVPADMVEQYQTVPVPSSASGRVRGSQNNIVECHAYYSQFRAFRADVKFDFEETEPSSVFEPQSGRILSHK
jgi:hypothetical protein